MTGQSCKVVSTAGEKTPFPIYLATAEKFRSELDWSDGGAASLAFQRTYRSTWASDALRPASGLGIVWSHNHHFTLRAIPTTTPNAVAITSPGRLKYFQIDQITANAIPAQ